MQVGRRTLLLAHLLTGRRRLLLLIRRRSLLAGGRRLLVLRECRQRAEAKSGGNCDDGCSGEQPTKV